MSNDLIKISLSEYAKIDGRHYQTILEHIKKGNIKGVQENGRWFVWAQSDLKENSDSFKEDKGDFKGEEGDFKEHNGGFQENNETQKNHENTGLIEVFRREQDLQANLQRQIEQFSIERERSAKETRKMWIGVSLFMIFGIIGIVLSFMLILERNASKMSIEREKIVQALREDQKKAIDSLNNEQKNNLEALIEINKTNIESIKSQHDAEIERLEAIRENVIQKLEDRFKNDLKINEERHKKEISDILNTVIKNKEEPIIK